jgi:hypothetical protein
MSRKETLVALYFAFTIFGVAEFAAASCPFCPPAQPTLSEQLSQCEVAVLARWEKLDKPTGELEGAEPRTFFTILQVLKPPMIAESAMKKDGTLIVNFQRDGKPGDWLLMLRNTDADGLNQWTISSVDEVSYGYVKGIPSLEQPPVERLAYFLARLEHDDAFIANDAFAEFTQAKYQDVALLAPKLDREKIRAWLEDIEDKKLMRHGFYGMLLGLCGNQDDAEFLARRVMAPPEPDKPRLCIDGLMAGYVLLTGERGLEKIVDAKLRVSPRDDGEVTFVMSLLRFLKEFASSRVDSAKVVAAMRMLLNDVKFAESAIIDLARWEDWEIVPQLIGKYGRPPFELPMGKQRVVQFALVAQKKLAQVQQPPETTQKTLDSIRGFLDRLRLEEPNVVKAAERALGPAPKTTKTDGPRNQVEGNLDVRPAGAADRNP